MAADDEGDVVYFDTPTVKKPTDEGRWARPSVAKTPAPAEGETVYFDRKKPAILPDVAKSAAAQGALGLVADIPGMIGSGGQLYDHAARWLMKNAVLNPAEAMGLFPKGKVDKFFADADKMKSPQERAGDVNMIFGLPFGTSQGFEKLARKAVPALGYEPRTTLGKFGASAARFATSSLVPGMGVGATAASRAGIGALTGLGSEAAGQVGDQFDVGPAARVAGAVAVPGLLGAASSAVKHWANPAGAAREKVVDALASDLNRGSSRASPATVNEALQQGVPAMAVDMAGDSTRKLVRRFGFQGPEAEKAFSDINVAMADRAQESGRRVSDLIMKQHGSPVMGGDPAKIEAAIAAADRPIVDRVYQIARADPAAQAVTSPKLEALSNSDTVRRAMNKAVSDATDPGSNIRAPTDTAHGNLAFWDQVKRNLDDRKAAAELAQESAEARRIGALQTGLRDELDVIVPAYKNARDVAAESFGKRNAVELGYSSLASGNAFDTRKLMDAYKKYNPDQQELFRQGVAAALAEKAQAGGPKALLKAMDSPQSKARLRETLGPAEYNTLYGQAQRDHILSNLRPLQAVEPASHSVRNAMVGAAVGAGASIISNSALGFSLANALQHGVASAAGAGLWSGIGSILSAHERHVAPHVLKLLRSSDPADIARLGADASRPGATRSFLDKMNSALTDAYVANYKANPSNSAQTDPDRPRRASGGRTRKNHAAEADRLVALVPSFRKAHASQTESLLQMPDAVVAKALAVADGRA